MCNHPSHQALPLIQARHITSHRPDLAQPTKNLRLPDLVAPFLEHGIMGVAWFLSGRWVLHSFNDSALGFVGAAMMLWAGVKALILLATYGIALYAALFRRHWFGHVAERRHIARVNARITRDLEAGDVARAMDRMRGLLCAYPDNMGLRRRLAIYLMDAGQMAAAGRYIMLHPAPTAQEREAIRAFYKANGHDPFQILRKTVRGIRGPGLSRGSQRVLLRLYRSIDRPADRQSWLYRAVGRYLAYMLRPRAQVIWEDHRATVIETALLGSLMTAFVMLKG